MFRFACLFFAGNTVLDSGKGGLMNSCKSFTFEPWLIANI